MTVLVITQCIIDVFIILITAFLLAATLFFTPLRGGQNTVFFLSTCALFCASIFSLLADIFSATVCDGYIKNKSIQAAEVNILCLSNLRGIFSVTSYCLMVIFAGFVLLLKKYKSFLAACLGILLISFVAVSATALLLPV